MNWFKKLFSKFSQEKETISPTDISLIKDVIKNTLLVITSYKDANKDSKVSFLEWSDIAKSALPLFNNLKKYKLLKAQILDFKSDEGKDLVDYCVSLGIVSEDAEIIIVNAIEAAEGFVEIYKNNIIPIWEVVKSLKQK